MSAVAISATTYNGYAIGDDGKLYAWGVNSYGKLGYRYHHRPRTVCAAPCSTTPVRVDVAGELRAGGSAVAGSVERTRPTRSLQYVSPGSPATISGTPPVARSRRCAVQLQLHASAARLHRPRRCPPARCHPASRCPATATLSGTPTAPGSYNFTVTAGNGAGPERIDDGHGRGAAVDLGWRGQHPRRRQRHSRPEVPGHVVVAVQRARDRAVHAARRTERRHGNRSEECRFRGRLPRQRGRHEDAHVHTHRYGAHARREGTSR